MDFEIKKLGAKIGETSAKGWTMEINLVSWYGKEPKWDIRSWNPDHTKMGKGVVLTDFELRNLAEFIRAAVMGQ